MSGEIKFVDT